MPVTSWCLNTWLKTWNNTDTGSAICTTWGECEVKHGVRVSVVNLYTEDVGNPEVPQKVREARHKAAAPVGGRQGLSKSWIVAAALIIHWLP